MFSLSLLAQLVSLCVAVVPPLLLALLAVAPRRRSKIGERPASTLVGVSQVGSKCQFLSIHTCIKVNTFISSMYANRYSKRTPKVKPNDPATWPIESVTHTKTRRKNSFPAANDNNQEWKKLPTTNDAARSRTSVRVPITHTQPE